MVKKLGKESRYGMAGTLWPYSTLGYQPESSGVEGHVTPNNEFAFNFEFFMISFFDTKNGFDDCRKLNPRKFYFGII